MSAADEAFPGAVGGRDFNLASSPVDYGESRAGAMGVGLEFGPEELLTPVQRGFCGTDGVELR